MYKATRTYFQPSICNEWIDERMNETLCLPTACWESLYFSFTPHQASLYYVFQLLNKLGWRQEIEWFPANDLSERGNETRICSKNPLGKLGYHIGVKNPHEVAFTDVTQYFWKFEWNILSKLVKKLSAVSSWFWLKCGSPTWWDMLCIQSQRAVSLEITKEEATVHRRRRRRRRARYHGRHISGGWAFFVV